MPLLEVCVDTIGGVAAAADGGADRMELCAALSEGGVTPSAALVAAAVRRAGSIPVHVLIRPRCGDFAYSAEEVNVMCEDIAHAARAGARGVVLGALSAEGDLDKPAMSRLLDASRGLDVTFHRAVDVSRDPLHVIRECRALGIRRVLTSGAARSVDRGLDVLGAMLREAGDEVRTPRATAAALAPLNDGDDQVAIMAGGGLNESNVATLLSLGVRELHGSCRELVASASTFCPTERGVAIGPQGAGFERQEATAQRVRAIKRAIDEWSASEQRAGGAAGTAVAEL